MSKGPQLNKESGASYEQGVSDEQEASAEHLELSTTENNTSTASTSAFSRSHKLQNFSDIDSANHENLSLTWMNKKVIYST